MKTQTPKLFVLLLIAAIVLSACNNNAAAKPGVWYNPFSWGDQTAEQTAAEILAEAQAQKTIREAQAAATAMAGGVTPTTVVQLTEVVPPTAAPTIASTIQPTAQPTPQMSAADARAQQLYDLDKVYGNANWQGWLTAAGIKFDASKVESRQPVETGVTVNGEYSTVVAGLVIRATGMEVNWPSCISTDRVNEVQTSASTKQHQPDLRNPSVLYTNVVLNGQATVYANCSDWGQLDPTK